MLFAFGSKPAVEKSSASFGEPATGSLLVKPQPLPPTSVHCHCKRSAGNGARTKRAGAANSTRLRSLALIFFVLACLYWLYKFYTNATAASPPTPRPHHQQVRQTGRLASAPRPKLKLVSVLGRHGDRSPSDRLPASDAPQSDFFWPRGASNLTELGRFRQFKIGLELGRRYNQLLDLNASHYLAFSSPFIRCRESLDHTLRGLFDIEWTLPEGLNLVQECAANQSRKRPAVAPFSRHEPNTAEVCPRAPEFLPSGSGSPLEYKQITIDTKTVPTLSYIPFNKCKFRANNPTPVDRNLSASLAVASLRGINELVSLIERKYSVKWQFEALGFWSTLAGELKLRRTRRSVSFGGHYYDWVGRPVAEYEARGVPVTMFDLYEQVAVLSYRDRIEGTANKIQLGPIISSILASQRSALNGYRVGSPGSNHNGPRPNLAFDSSQLYADKRAVFYSTHDSILQLLLHRLGIIQAINANGLTANGEDFETLFKRFVRPKTGEKEGRQGNEVESDRADDVEQMRAGLRMSKFGMSLVFELYELDEEVRGQWNATAHSQMQALTPFAYVEAVLYNEEDGKHKPVRYKRLELGEICRKLFKSQHPNATDLTLAQAFYTKSPASFEQLVSGAVVDQAFANAQGGQLAPGELIKFGCPFELFANVTSSYAISSGHFQELCAY